MKILHARLNFGVYLENCKESGLHTSGTSIKPTVLV